jgi:hypothetical protein
LDEGPILYSQLLDKPADVELVEAPVEVVFQEVAPGSSLPYFRLLGASKGAASKANPDGQEAYV